MASPVLLAIALMIWRPANLSVLPISLMCLLTGCAMLAFLPGWPLLQATSASLVGPWKAFKSTRGLRWQLFLASFLASGLNKAIPKVSSTESLAGASVLALLGGVVTCFSLMLAAAIGVSAWRHMTSD
ncbi:hypothetical protein [Caulobacter sp. X]|uniref:hypothetical protein n=1 Tax=Caulobacter sp. X TaxID=2048901 RepID=UPI000C16147D|nr:hypothetical protein [Caulobacter sp. X]PIC02010.1 hypothetical protein CSW60_11200 [Caulobacter sp. X]